MVECSGGPVLVFSVPVRFRYSRIFIFRFRYGTGTDFSVNGTVPVPVPFFRYQYRVFRYWQKDHFGLYCAEYMPNQYVFDCNLTQGHN